MKVNFRTDIKKMKWFSFKKIQHLAKRENLTMNIKTAINKNKIKCIIRGEAIVENQKKMRYQLVKF